MNVKASRSKSLCFTTEGGRRGAEKHGLMENYSKILVWFGGLFNPITVRSLKGGIRLEKWDRQSFTSWLVFAWGTRGKMLCANSKQALSSRRDTLISLGAEFRTTCYRIWITIVQERLGFVWFFKADHRSFNISLMSTVDEWGSWV